MYWQLREILRRYNVSPDTQTLVVNLPRANYLSGLLCRYEATTGATAGQVTAPSYIPSISLLADGSTELFYSNCYEALLAHYGLTGKVPPIVISTSSGSAIGWTFQIPFGRYFGDPNFYLDCGRYSSLELRVTFSPTVAATGIATGSQYFTVLGLMAMEAPPGARIGTLKTTRKNYFTTSASGDVEIELPRGNVYRKLIITDEGEAAVLSTAFSRIALDVNNGEKIIFAADTGSFQRFLNVHNGEQLNVTDNTTSHALSTAQLPAVLGNVYAIPFDVGNDITNGLNSAQYGSVKLTLTQAAASHVIGVMLQEIVI